jgi:hypothetical protein
MSKERCPISKNSELGRAHSGRWLVELGAILRGDLNVRDDNHIWLFT